MKGGVLNETLQNHCSWENYYAMDIFDILDCAYNRYFTGFRTIWIVDSFELVNLNDV